MFKRASKIILAGLILAPPIAMATPITVDFTITTIGAISTADGDETSYNGYGIGTVGGGYFTIDNAVGNVGDPFGPGVVPIELRFDWAGIHLDETMARFWVLLFDSNGELSAWNLGADPDLTELSSPGPTDFFAQGAVPHSDYDYTMAHLEGVDGMIEGAIDWRVRAVSVPEPGALGLLAIGLLGIAAARRKLTV